MLFSSIAFIYLFLPTVLFVYFLILKKSRMLQNVFLLFASLLFYAWGEPKFVLIMLAAIVSNWAIGLAIDKYRYKKVCTLLLVLSLIVNLGLLFAYKYLNFADSIIYSVFGKGLGIPQIALPIGISFFTFQGLSYIFDVYRGTAGVQRNILYVGLYISFFPQLIAGPIVRYETVADEIANRKETADDFFDGFARFVGGLAKKVLLSNALGILADQAFDSVAAGNTLSSSFCWLGAIAYTLQIFFDFSGYSDMAIGLGRMFGFHFLENFNYPYISTSISEFWRRWHISLGTWFRDYLYFPLGGSRVKPPRAIFNLFVVWFLTGLWHGANFTFIVWGLMYFVLIALEKITHFDKNKSQNGVVAKIIKMSYTLFFVILGWVFFRSDSLETAWIYTKTMFGFSAGSMFDGVFWGYLSQNAILLCIGILFCTPLIKTLKEKMEARKSRTFAILSTLFLILVFVLSVASLVSSSYNPFIYFNF